jgi:hypothetical protein
MKLVGVGLACCMASLIAAPAFAQTTNESASGDKMGDIAKKLNYPVADLVRAPARLGLT